MFVSFYFLNNIINYNFLKNKFNKLTKINKLYKLRKKLKNINNINCVINILKEINESNSDNLISIVYSCYLIEPPNDIEIQTISILQQQYQDTFNIEEYSILTLWCCILHYIDNLPKIKKQKTWP